MLRILSKLLPIHYHERSLINSELDDVSQVTFLQHGIYDYGFEINKKYVFCLRKPEGGIIGLFECFFNRRCTFVIRAETPCYGYYITKKEWQMLEEIFMEGYRGLKFRCLNEYLNKLKAPINKRKDYWIEYYDQRKDFHQKLTLQDYDPADDFKLQKKMMEDLL